MRRRNNEVRCRPFEVEDFTRTVREASSAISEDPEIEQVAYLGRYLERLGARTLVIESHYVDRHFVEEFSLYYARCLTPPSSVCHRLHFFSRDVSDEELDQELRRAAESIELKAEVERALSHDYLGFIVVRPLAHVPVGRTILRPLEDQAERHIFTTTRNTVHLLGLELTLTGLAFQQQDRAVGACATAALWMALSRVARLEGARAPTPAFITEAASRRSLAEGRPLPSRGLTHGQVMDAIRESGFAPELLRATGNPQAFLAMLHCYLRSGIPVLLIVEEDSWNEVHAVTAVGYRVGPPRPELQFEPIRSMSMYIEQLYVHDDRLGPYARASLEVRETELYLHIERDAGEQEGALLVRFAIVPVYPKLRCSAEDVWPMATRFKELVQDVTEEPQTSCETFFVRAGDYLDELVRLRAVHDIQLPEKHWSQFMRQAAFSRWICVARWWSEDKRPLADFIYDTTDVVRFPERVDSLLLGMVAFDERLRSSLHLLGRNWGTPVV